MFKPMLATAIEDVSKLKFPLLASQKLDGIRATVQDRRLMSRSLKPIPNKYVQELFAGLPEGLDGELILGDPLDPECYRKTVSLVMSDDHAIVGDLHYWVFDKFGVGEFNDRLYNAIEASGHNGCVYPVPHVKIPNLAALESYETELLEAGAEGVMLRSLDSPYKQGRSSLKEGYLLKLKRFRDCEARITGYYELMHNENEAFKNELGRTARSSHQTNKTGLDTLGGLEVVGVGGEYDGVNFRVGTGFDAAMRTAIWSKNHVGELIKVKYFPTGGKDKPRHPVFLGFRDARDLS